MRYKYFAFAVIVLFSCHSNNETKSQAEKTSKTSQFKDKRAIEQPLIASQSVDIIPSEKAKEIISKRAREVIRAIKLQDFKKWATVVHPLKGVRLSAYSYVSIKEDRVFSASQIESIMKDDKKYTWGYYDGTGDEMMIDFLEYYKQFIYDEDFANAPQINFNKVIQRGNTIDNTFKIYPNSIIVEYYFSGFDPKYEGMDWKALKLIFQESQGVWYLVGIVHNEWTT